MKPRTRVAVVALAAMLGMLAACGGGSGDKAGAKGSGSPASGKGSTPLSRAELITLAGSLCKKYEAEIDALKPPGDSPADIAASLRSVVGLLGRMRDDLRKLTPPADIRADFESLLGKLDRLIVLTGQVAAALARNDPAAAQSVQQELETLGGQAEALSKKLGIEECATSE
ncbi:MAG: hypothetical protein ACRDJM_04890 [Actinomycetota bacterium]